MTPHQELILARLRDVPGEFVSVPELLEATGREDSLASRRVLRVQICRLRKEFWTIEGKRGSHSRGYRLVRVPT